MAPRKGKIRTPAGHCTPRAASERGGHGGLGGLGTIFIQPPNNDGDKDNKYADNPKQSLLGHTASIIKLSARNN